MSVSWAFGASDGQSSEITGASPSRNMPRLQKQTHPEVDLEHRERHVDHRVFPGDWRGGSPS